MSNTITMLRMAPMEADGELYAVTIGTGAIGLTDDIARWEDALANSSAFQSWVGALNYADALAHVFRWDIERSDFTDQFAIISQGPGWQTRRQSLTAADSVKTFSRIKIQFFESVSDRKAEDAVVIDELQVHVDEIIADLWKSNIMSVCAPVDGSPARASWAEDQDAAYVGIYVEGIEIGPVA